MPCLYLEKTVTLYVGNLLGVLQAMVNRFLESRLSCIIICIVLCGLDVSCTELPKYAAPYIQKSTTDSIPPGSGFSYRTLTLADFQSPEKTSKKRDSQYNIHAQSCIRMHVSKDSVMEITSVMINGKKQYTGRMVDASFQALFQPSCSWWNPEVPEDKESYILQHEQVHFALSELTAHRLTEYMHEQMQGYVVKGETYDDVETQLNAHFQKLAAAEIESELKYHNQFDKETSIVVDRHAQEAWLKRVQLQLQEHK